MQTVPRLIGTFIPREYILSLSLDRTKRTFSGRVIISGELPKKSNKIFLHSKDLTIKSVTVNKKLVKFTLGENDSLNIENNPMSLGVRSIEIEFSGKITDSMHGMYPCYFEHNNIKKELLVTQFESHHAREVFPCIDEPEAKATFAVTLETETNVHVLGNMPIKTQYNENSRTVTKFETTPIMSSYLLAWVVGELQKKTGKTKRGTLVNVWATPAQPATSLDLPLDIAIRSIDFFEKYFGTNYPLAKCDNVALPDFGSGAMENWGLVTYREIAMLADPKTTSVSSRQYAATVIAHELSHQWFGNLVTMKWWNDLWLNESFATLIEYVAVDAIEPSWNIWMDFASFETAASLRRDSLAGVQPVQIDVNHPDEIGTLFDGAIVYAKGARLMKMMRRYIGDDDFKSGLTKYFKQYAYKNTEAKDLWRVLSDECNKNVGEFMTRWISQPGFPVLNVTREKNTIILSQERLSNGLGIRDDSLWPIPLNSNYPEMPEIFDVKNLSVEVADSKPIRFNIGNDAHYLTHYDSNLLEQLVDEVKSGKLNPLDRMQLLNEQIILASAGIIPSAELIPLIDAFKNETSEPVWSVLGMAIGELKKFVEDNDEAETKLRKLTGIIAKNQFERLGWNEKVSEPEDDTKLRSTIISLILYSEDKNALDYANKLYESVTVDKLNPELRSVIISSVIRQKNDIETVDKLLNKYETTASSELKQDINLGVTATKDEKIVDLLLNKLKETSVIRTQDTARWIAYLLRNKFARQQTWRWVRDNWDWIKETFGGDKSYDDYPRYVAMTLSTQKQLDEYVKFFDDIKSDPSLTRVIDMGINEIKNKVKIIEENGVSIQNTLLNL
ncbi:MAG: M1 family metallopeptidase [Candidatus Saccharibacteria bacterium]|nr:M1 family metallopeptidase [Candidatus Saccharibacteria bacterium]